MEGTTPTALSVGMGGGEGANESTRIVRMTVLHLRIVADSHQGAADLRREAAGGEAEAEAEVGGRGQNIESRYRVCLFQRRGKISKIFSDR
jgi:hypothetical protein